MSETVTKEPEVIPVNILEGKDRITINLNIYYEHSGDLPHQIICPRNIISKSSDLEPYSRKIVVGPDWELLDLGWFSTHKDQIGLIVIESLEGKYETKNPTKEERELSESRVIDVSLGDGPVAHVQIWAGWPFYFYQKNVADVQLRCLNGPTKAKIHIVPYRVLNG